MERLEGTEGGSNFLKNLSSGYVTNVDHYALCGHLKKFKGNILANSACHSHVERACIVKDVSKLTCVFRLKQESDVFSAKT